MKTVVSLGLHIVDILGRPVTHIPEGQNVDVIEEIRMTVAGTAAGTSVDMAKLGLDVRAMGAIGKDSLGDYIVETMGKYGIDTSGLVRKDGVQTSATMLPIRPNGERPALHVPGATGELTWEDLDLELLEGADIFHMGGTSLMPKFDGEPTRRVLEYAKEQGLTTTFDLVADQNAPLQELIEPCLPYIDYFLPGLEEGAMISGLEDRRDIIEFFLERGVGHTVFTMGGEGASVAYRDNGSTKEIRVPSYEVELVDSTGCGDGFCAGFVAARAKGWDLEDAARMGAACGGLVATGLGSDAGIEDWEQVEQFMEETPTLSMESGA